MYRIFEKQQQQQASIWNCLNHYAFNDAIFLAERLHSEGLHLFLFIINYAPGY